MPAPNKKQLEHVINKLTKTTTKNRNGLYPEIVLPVKPRSVEMLSKCFLKGLIQHPAPLPSAPNKHKFEITN
jgi:hypothetical protein